MNERIISGQLMACCEDSCDITHTSNWLKMSLIKISDWANKNNEHEAIES